MAKKMAFDRIKRMDEQALRGYMLELERDLRVKQDKAQRLSEDIQRQENVLAAAHQERADRGSGTSYRGLDD